MNHGDESLELGQLLRHPREDLNVEFKEWVDFSDEMHRATVAKALLALANHGGGYVVFGFGEIDGQHAFVPHRPDSLEEYSQDTINDIVRRYAEPSFQCGVYHVEHPDGSGIFPIIVVPGGHRVPIRAKRDDPERRHIRLNCYYTRRTGPASEQAQSAQEWDDIIRRCVLAHREELLASVRHILYGIGESTRSPELARAQEWEAKGLERFRQLVSTHLADEHPSRYSRGIWMATYTFDPSLHRDPAELRDLLRSVSGHETGWPPWWVPTRDAIAPYPIDGFIECWIKETHFNDGAHSDFWRADGGGRLFLLRGHHEDSEGRFEPGSVLVYSNAIWEIGQVLLHLTRLAKALHGTGAATIRMRWTGLANRRLSSWRGGSFDFPKRVCRQDVVESEAVLELATIENALPECVGALAKPLFMAFDFYTPPPELYEREINELRRSRVS